MTKTILVMVITTILIVGTFALGSASALNFEEINWTPKKQFFSCSSPAGVDCGDGKLNGQVEILTVIDTEEILTGNGKAIFFLKGTNGEIEGKFIKLKSENLRFKHDILNGVTEIIGTAIDKRENIWNVDAIFENYSENNRNRVVADINLTLTSQTTGMIVDIESQEQLRVIALENE